MDIFTYNRYCATLDRMHRVMRYLGSQFSVRLTRPEAAAHFQARAIIAKAQNQILGEAEGLFMEGSCPTR